MCIYSMVIDWGREQWPDHRYPPKPNYIPISPAEEKKKWKKFLDLLDKAAEIDKVTGQPDCEDPEKVEWLKRVMKTIEDMEKKPKPKKDVKKPTKKATKKPVKK